MSPTKLLRNLHIAWRSRPRGRPGTIRRRLHLEALEDRSLPSTITVVNVADSGAGTLRAALAAAAPGDTVVFDPGLAGQTIALTGGALVLPDGVTVAGPGAGLLAVSAGGASRVVEVPLGVSATLSGLTLRDGVAPNQIGGGILNHGTLTLRNCDISNNQAVKGGRGGGIFSDGLLLATDCFVHDNKVFALNSAFGLGAGIFTTGTAGLTGCTVSNNIGVGDLNANQDRGNCLGGGVFNDTQGVITLINCTLANNQVQDGQSSAFGGGLQDNGTATVRSCTIAFNSSEGAAAGIHATLGCTLLLIDTFVAANNSPFGPDITGTVTSLGHNLVGNPTNTVGLIASDLQNIAILEINGLRDNGGPVPTVPLRSDSPAVNAGDSTGAPATDQRGFRRVVDGAIDIGAFEFQPPAVTVALTSSANPADEGAPVTFTTTVAGVAAGSSTPGGGALFFIDSVPQAAVGVHNGVATFTTTSLAVGTHDVEVQYAGDINFDGGSATLAPAQQIVDPPPTGPVSPAALDANHAFVQSLYQGVLGRPGSALELDGWVSVLLQGGNALVASSIEHSIEGRTHRVREFYQTLLGRTAQNGEEQGFVQELADGATEEQVEAGILGSQEFFGHAPQVPGVGGGPTTDRTFVKALYELLLNRTPNNDEVNGLVSLLPQLGRDGAAAFMLNSTEFRELQVRSFYSALLHRPNPTQGEVDGWVHSGLDQETIRSDFEGSLEFFATN
jgi:hypothetical protein